MKRLVSILSLLVALAAASCTHPEPAMPMPEAPQHSELAALDTLMQTEPDSALYALLDFNDNHKYLAPFDRHYADLLLSEALFKNDYEQTLRPEVQQAQTYFDSLAAAYPKNNDFTLLSARSHYMNGVGLMESDSTVEACTEYLKALEIMEDRFDEKELTGYKARFMALTYTRLMCVFSDLYLSEQAIMFGELSIPFFQKTDGADGFISYNLLEIGQNYEMREMLDSAEIHYQSAIEKMPDPTSELYRSIVANKALLLYKKEHNIEHPLQSLYGLLPQSVGEKELLSRQFSLGYLFFMDKQYDSAILYLDKVYEKTDDIEIKKQSAEWLVEAKEEVGDTTNVALYARYLVQFATDKEDGSPLNSVMTDLCNTYMQRKQETLYAKERKEGIKLIVVIIGSLALVFIIVALLYFFTRKRNKDLENKYKKKLEIQKSLSGRLKSSTENLKQEKEKTKSLQKELETIQQQKTWDSLDVFLEEDICKEIMASVGGKNFKREMEKSDYQDIILNNTQLARLSTAVEKHFSGFRKMLADKYPKMDENEFNLCYLYLLNLNDIQISALLNLGYSSLKKRVSKLKKAFKTEKELLRYICDMVM